MGIFKYMATNNYNKNLLKYIFEDNTLRFNSPLNFNDPFEMRHSIESLNPSKSDDLNNLINSTLPINLLHNISLDFELENVGTLCLSAKNNDIIMWSHYADSHRGIVLEFDETHPFFYESNKDKKLLHPLEKVSYSIDRPYPKNIDEYFKNEKIYLTKYTNWEYEQEYRMTVLFDESNDETKYNIKFPTSLIKAVYIGVKTSKEDVKYILNLKQKQKWQHLDIFKFEMDKKDYKLNLFKANFK